MKKLKYNVFSNGFTFEAGKIYSDEETKDLDPNDLEDINSDTVKVEEGEVEVVEVKKKTTKTKAK
jgi:hypothetical protein